MPLPSYHQGRHWPSLPLLRRCPHPTCAIWCHRIRRLLQVHERRRLLVVVLLRVRRMLGMLLQIERQVVVLRMMVRGGERRAGAAAANCRHHASRI